MMAHEELLAKLPEEIAGREIELRRMLDAEHPDPTALGAAHGNLSRCYAILLAGRRVAEVEGLRSLLAQIVDRLESKFLADADDVDMLEELRQSLASCELELPKARRSLAVAIQFDTPFD